jgi:hypothetical protein
LASTADGLRRKISIEALRDLLALAVLPAGFIVLLIYLVG